MQQSDYTRRALEWSTYITVSWMEILLQLTFPKVNNFSFKHHLPVCLFPFVIAFSLMIQQIFHSCTYVINVFNQSNCFWQKNKLTNKRLVGLKIQKNRIQNWRARWLYYFSYFLLRISRPTTASEEYSSAIRGRCFPTSSPSEARKRKYYYPQ